MTHLEQVLSLLRYQIRNPEEVNEIQETAAQVASNWVDPVSGGKESINGLIYGLIQSGKTGVLTVSAAYGADEGYRTVVILTSDNDPLYAQTLARVHEALPGMDILEKKDFRDRDSFVKRIRATTCAIVATKNSGILRTLCENFQYGRVRGLSCLIIDDEADQASLNTRTSRGDGSRSTINSRIVELRSFFDKNTYMQVTATPQALFLQTLNHDFRPQFTVLSHPGSDYVGGDDFFGEESQLVREFDINDLIVLAPGAQPSPTLEIPRSLLQSLDVFMLAATYKRMNEPDQNCAFLCHVSTRTSDHKHIVELLRKYKTELTTNLKTNNRKVLERFQLAYDDLCMTQPALKLVPLKELISRVEFLSPGISVKLVNGETDEDVALTSPYNLFVGGNKLGRGVTIKNLLVSYYGRHPRRPQADTVLQHARMYGYRRRDIGILRLYLPSALHVVYKAIHKMEISLRTLIARSPNEEFRGVYVEGMLNPTRRNVLAPGSIGVYTGGGIYNPAQIARDPSVVANTEKIDSLVEGVNNKAYVELPIARLKELVALTLPDQSKSERVWDPVAIAESLEQFAKLYNQTSGYLYLDRDRGLKEDRRETQGILDGGESSRVPNSKLTLFLLRTKREAKSCPAWWPQIRFPDGRYAFAFSI